MMGASSYGYRDADSPIRVNLQGTTPLWVSSDIYSRCNTCKACFPQALPVSFAKHLLEPDDDQKIDYDRVVLKGSSH